MSTRPGLFCARLAAGVIVLVSAPALADAPTTARLSCRPEAGPGRVLCELEVEARSASLAWADGLVVRSPEFASPLRSRVGKSQASAKTPTRLRLPIALAATGTGQGTLEVAARWVVCQQNVGCFSGRTTTSAQVRVGAIAEP